MPDTTDPADQGLISLEQLVSGALEVVQLSLATAGHSGPDLEAIAVIDEAERRTTARAKLLVHAAPASETFAPLLAVCRRAQSEARAVLEAGGLARARGERCSALDNAGERGDDAIASQAMADAVEAWGRMRVLVLEAGETALAMSHIVDGYSLLRTLLEHDDPLRLRALDAIDRTLSLIDSDLDVLKTMCSAVITDASADQRLRELVQTAIFNMAVCEGEPYPQTRLYLLRTLRSWEVPRSSPPYIYLPELAALVVGNPGLTRAFRTASLNPWPDPTQKWTRP